MKRVAAVLTGARTARGVLLVFVLVVGLGLAFLPHPSVTAITNPATAGDSARVAVWQADVPNGALVNAIVVWSRADGQPLTTAQRSAVIARVHSVAALSAQPKVAWAQPGKGFTAFLAIVPMHTAAVLANAPGVEEKLTATADAGLSRDIRVRLTGDVAMLAADARASENANGFLPIFWLLVVAAAALLLTSRKFLLWLVPFVVSAAAAFFADFAALAIAGAVGLPVPSGAMPYLLAIAVGLSTAVSVVYVVRYRREYDPESDYFAAGARTWTAAVRGIAVTALVFVLGALVLLFAPDSGWQAFGLAAALAIVIAGILALVAVPAGLALIGRNAFWPHKASQSHEPISTTRLSLERRSVLFTALALILVSVVAVGGAAGLIALTAPPSDAQSTQARATIDRYFEHGFGDESIMIVPNSLQGETSTVAPTTFAMNLPGGHSVTVGPSRDGRTELLTYFNIDPGSDLAHSTIRKLRHLIAVTGGPTATSLVGGSDANAVDKVDAAPLVALTAVIALILVALLLGLADWRQRRRAS
jgi:RND superfamily putative drug exporter